MARRSKTQRTKTNKGGRTKKKLSFKLKALLWGGGSVLGIILLSFGLYHAALSYLQNDSFREKLEDSAQNKMQADYVRIKHNLKLGDKQINLEQLELGRKDALESLVIEGVRAHYNKGELYDKKLHLNSTEIAQLDLRFNLNRRHRKLPPIKEENKGFFDRFIPQQYQIDLIRCADANLVIIDGPSTYKLSHFALAAEPSDNKGLQAWQISLKRGFISTPFELIQKCRVESANLSITPEGYALDDCRILLAPGDIQLKGVYNKESEKWTAELQSNKANVRQLLNESWKARLSGDLFCKLLLSGDGDGIQRVSGSMYLQQGVVEALPFLGEVKVHDSYPYRNLPIHTATCKVSYPYQEATLNIKEAWLFDEIDIISKGKLMIRGHIIIGKDKSLGGSLLVGLPEAVVNSISNGEEGMVSQIFNAGSADNFVWLRINLSGTLDDPQQDLSIRLEQIAKTYALGKADAAASGIMNTLQTIVPAIGFGAGPAPKADADADPTSPSESDGDSKPAPAKSPGLLESGADKAKNVLESIF